MAAHVNEKVMALGEEIIPQLEEAWEQNLDPEAQKKLEDLIHTLQYRGLKQRLAVWKESGGTDLLEGMWLVNSFQYPDVPLEEVKQLVEQLFFEAWTHLKPGMKPFEQVKALNNVLFRIHKFSANAKNFHAPANSMIHQVLTTRRGNPLTLCVIYLLIAQKLELPVYGVNLPNLFILTYKKDETQFYINVYNRGLILSKSDIDNYILQLNLNPVDIFYEPTTNVEIVKRALRNLAVSYEKMDDPERAAEVTMLLDSITDEQPPV